MFRSADAQQLAYEPRVHPVDLGRLDETLSWVARPGGQAKHEDARLEDREPGTRRVVRNAGVRAKIGQVELLGGATRQKSHERGECLEVSHREQSAHVALKVGLNVVGQPAVCGNALIVYAREAAGDQSGEQVDGGIAKTPQLVDRQRQQVKDSRPPGQGLGY